jgi:hypothetical protein
MGRKPTIVGEDMLTDAKYVGQTLHCLPRHAGEVGYARNNEIERWDDNTKKAKRNGMCLAGGNICTRAMPRMHTYTVAP